MRKVPYSEGLVVLATTLVVSVASGQSLMYSCLNREGKLLRVALVTQIPSDPSVQKDRG
jgi:hypothetical protein